MGDISPENTVIASERWHSARITMFAIGIWNNCGTTPVYPGKCIFRRDGVVFRLLVKLSAGFLVPVYFLLHCSIVVILDLPLPVLLNSFIMVSEWCLWGPVLPHAGFGLKASLTSRLPTAIPFPLPPHHHVPLAVVPKKPPSCPQSKSDHWTGSG